MTMEVWLLIIPAAVLSGLLFMILLPYVVYPSPRTKPKREHYEVAVVLGNPATADGKPAPIMRERVKKAVELYQKGFVSHLICSGGGVGNRWVEARVMADFAMALGVPENDVLVETGSRDTVQNLKNSAEIMQAMGWTSAAIVSSPWHLRRTNRLLKNCGYDYVMVKSTVPEEFSILYVLAIYLWEHRLMTRWILRGKLKGR